MKRLALIIAFACSFAVGCGPTDPLHATTVQLGRSLNSDNSVGTFATRFKPDDTIHIAVLTDKPGRGTFKVRWTFRGQSINEEERSVSYRDEAATEFHINYPGGLPPGDYKVDVQLDDMPAGMREFVVEK